MIILFILIALVIAGVVLCLLANVADIFYVEDIPDIIGVCLISICGFSLLVCSIFTIVRNSKVSKEHKTIEIQETIESINETRKTLEYKISSESYTVLEINEYNNNVKEYKTEIKQANLILNNPWINWFENPAYKEFNGNEVSYLYVK